MTISKERLGELLQGCEQPEDMVGDTGKSGVLYIH